MSKIHHKRVVEALIRPFKKHLLFLIAFFVLATSPFILIQIFSYNFYVNALLLTIHCFVLSYIITLLISAIGSKALRRFFQSIILSISAVSFAVNVYCVLKLGYLFDLDVAMLILGTNANEAKEFASVMLPKDIVFIVLGTYLVFIGLWVLFARHHLNLGKKTSLFALAFLLLCVGINAYSWGIWKDGPIAQWYEMSQYETTGDLQSHYTHPQLSLMDEPLPSNVVLIIGESYTRNHSSLYGYDKETNPYLTAFRDSSMLFTFDSIDAPAPTTAESIRYMLSIYNKSDHQKANSKKWFEYTSIIEVMQQLGYDCFWFSNQARGSKFNGPSRVFADACQHHHFYQEEGSNRYNTILDMVLVDSSYQSINHRYTQKPRFVVYHMMGSHFDFNLRYPKAFSKFAENDYQNNPSQHRAILAAYDNSILYNDYVVTQIINLFRDKDAIIIYLPDHGQVMYRNPKAPNYFAHGSNNDPVGYKLGVEIPFMIFASPLFQERHPETTQRIMNRQSNPRPWNSDDLPYFIMDIIGLSSIDGESIGEKSILN